MNSTKTIFPAKTKNIVWKADLSSTKPTKRLAVFASYSSNEKIADYVLYYLKGLKKVCDAIIFIADNPLLAEELDKIKEFVVYAKAKRHNEYDFGSYKRGYIYAYNNRLLDNSAQSKGYHSSQTQPRWNRKYFRFFEKSQPYHLQIFIKSTRKYNLNIQN